MRPCLQNATCDHPDTLILITSENYQKVSYICFPQHNVWAMSYLSCLFFNGILCTTVTVLKPQQEDVCTSVKQNHTSLKWLAFFFTLCPLTNLKKLNCSILTRSLVNMIHIAHLIWPEFHEESRNSGQGPNIPNIP